MSRSPTAVIYSGVLNNEPRTRDAALDLGDRVELRPEHTIDALPPENWDPEAGGGCPKWSAHSPPGRHPPPELAHAQVDAPRLGLQDQDDRACGRGETHAL